MQEFVSMALFSIKFRYKNLLSLLWLVKRSYIHFTCNAWLVKYISRILTSLRFREISFVTSRQTRQVIVKFILQVIINEKIVPNQSYDQQNVTVLVK